MTKKNVIKFPKTIKEEDFRNAFIDTMTTFSDSLGDDLAEALGFFEQHLVDKISVFELNNPILRSMENDGKKITD